jgi:uncharacterized protein (DUF1499 family)
MAGGESRANHDGNEQSQTIWRIVLPWLRCYRATVAALVLVAISAVCVRMYSDRIPIPADIRFPVSGQLATCGSRTNCVHTEISLSCKTQKSSGDKQVLAGGKTPHSQTPNTLKALIASDGGRVRVIAGNYLAALYKSRVFAFPDDVELLYLPNTHSVAIRSASRIGTGGFGANARRVNRLRRRFRAQCSQ